MSKEIPLTKGKIAIVDDEDYDRVSAFKWFAHLKKNTCYAARNDRAHHKVWMHRFITDAPDGVQVDHRDRDGLNNRRQNLRLATHAQNQHNIPPQSNNKSGYKGVYQRSSGRWGAWIRGEWLGTFLDARSAALAHDVRARELYGEFAWLNFPNEAIHEQE